MGCLRIPAWPRVAELLFTPDVLRAAQACAAWHAMVDEAALWSARAVGRALEKLDACEAAAAASLAMSADARGRTARTARLGKLFALPAERRPKYVLLCQALSAYQNSRCGNRELYSEAEGARIWKVSI